MTDYRKYRSHVGIENVDMTRTISGMFRKFDKVSSNYINHPQQRGVCLLPEAEQLLVQVYGPGPGLNSIPFSGDEKPKRKRSDKRRKCNAVTFRMDDETMSKAVELKQASGCMTMQELFEMLLRRAIAEMESEP